MDPITSRNGRLEAGMTIEILHAKIAKEGLNESDRATEKLLQAFYVADGLADGIKDGIISEKEIELYDKEIRKKNIKTGLMIASGIALAAITTFAIIKGIKARKPMSFEEVLNADAKSAFSKVNPDNFKDEGISYLVDVEKSATPACKLRIGKTVGETLELNKEVGLELVQNPDGRFVYGLKRPRIGWEKLPGWNNQYADKTFQELKIMYPGINSDMYFLPAGPGIVKAYGANIENGMAVIRRAPDGIRDVAFQVNTSFGRGGARDLVNITHVYEDGSAIIFDEMKEGWTILKKGQYNPANPSCPIPIKQTINFNEIKAVNTLEGLILTDMSMTDGGGFPYNKFPDFWRQVMRGKVRVNLADSGSVRLFDQAELFQGLTKEINAMKSAGRSAEAKILEGRLHECENAVKKLIFETAKAK